MPNSRFLALLGCSVALLVGLAALALPGQAMELALTAAVAAGVDAGALRHGRTPSVQKEKEISLH